MCVVLCCVVLCVCVCVCVCVGAIHYTDGRDPMEVYRTVGPVLSLLFSPERQYLVVVTQSMDLCQVAISPKGEATEMMKVGRAVCAPPDAGCLRCWLKVCSVSTGAAGW